MQSLALIPHKVIDENQRRILMLQRSTRVLVILLFLATCVYGQTTEPSPKPTEKNKYDLLVEKAKQKDPSLDFTELRVAFYESANYHPLTPMMTYRPLNAALAQKNYEEALKIAESVLAKNFVEVNAHMVAQIAYQETGNAERAELHKYMADGLLSSIKASGDGKTTKTAFEVISINEEYGLVRSLGLRPIKQALVNDKGHSYDALTVIDPQTNQQSIIYFNVDKPFAWENRKK
jgi:tetratricopeptide (TPR) repeat protein